MFDLMVNYFTALQNNPLLFAVFGSSIIGAILYICRDVPVKFFNFILDVLTIKIEVHQSTDEEAFMCIDDELKKNKLYYITGKFQLIHEWMMKKITLSCGEHNKFLTRMNRKWVLVNKTTDDNVKFWHTMTYTLRFFSRDKNSLDIFVDGLLTKRHAACPQNSIKIFKWSGARWDYFTKRKIDTDCFFPSKQDSIINRLCFFLNNEELYIRKNKPRRIGILLHGKPGCGKTHFIHTLASILELNVYYVNPQEFKNDADFIKAIMTIKNPSILLFEDIDCNENFHNRVEKDKKKKLQQDLSNKTSNNTSEYDNGISMSTMLNVFDGLLAQEEQVIIATTNHIEKLDTALLRAGRFDIKEEFEFLNKNEICKFIFNWFENKIIDVTIPNDKCISISELSRICTESKMIDEAVEKLLDHKEVKIEDMHVEKTMP